MGRPAFGVGAGISGFSLSLPRSAMAVLLLLLHPAPRLRFVRSRANFSPPAQPMNTSAEATSAQPRRERVSPIVCPELALPTGNEPDSGRTCRGAQSGEPE